MLNEEEANLQNEIMSLHLREMGKVREIEHKHNIQPSYKSSTRQMARQHQEYTPYFPSRMITIFIKNLI